MKTYPTMNAKIVDLLKMKDDPTSLYAAARIEELERRVKRAEKMEKALDRACGYIAEHDFDLPCPDYIDGWDGCEKKEEGCTYDIARPAECWKRYFMETDR